MTNANKLSRLRGWMYFFFAAVVLLGFLIYWLAIHESSQPFIYQFN